MDYITAFSDGLQLLLNNGKSNFISPAIREATDRHCMIQIELALIILIKRFSLHPQQAHTHTRTHTRSDAQAHPANSATESEKQTGLWKYTESRSCQNSFECWNEWFSETEQEFDIWWQSSIALIYICLFFLWACAKQRETALQHDNL